MKINPPVKAGGLSICWQPSREELRKCNASGRFVKIASPEVLTAIAKA
jgi:hypothetical protein